MMIISFAWTTPALLAGRKTVTRRNWDPHYARRFQPGDKVTAYNRSPRHGGKPVAVIRIKSIRLEPMATMPDSDYEAEGFAYLNERNIRPIDTSREGFNAWRQKPTVMYVVRFELVEILDTKQKELL